jgi:hypothetical protein
MTTDLIMLPAFAPQVLRAMGIDVPQALRIAGLPASLFRDGKAHVTTQQFFALWTALESAGASPDLGLRLGAAEPPPGQYDIATMTALHSETFGAALAKLGRYKKLVCPELLSIETKMGEARLEFRWLLAESRVPMFLADSAFASTARLLENGTQQRVAPLRVELTRCAQHTAMLRKHFGCEIAFNRPRDLLVSSRKYWTYRFAPTIPSFSSCWFRDSSRL